MKMCRWKVWSGLALTFILLCALPQRADTGMTIIRDAGQEAEPEQKVQVLWVTDPGIRYELQESVDLEHWTTVEGFPTEAQALAQQYVIERETAGTHRFFRVHALDEQPPVITRSLPAEGAFGVRRYSAITLDLVDATGIDPASILLTVGGHGTFTLADAELQFVDGELVFDSGGDTVLGGWGETIEISLTVADTLGNTESHEWSFRLELKPVYVEALFVFGSPDAIHLGQQIQPTPTSIMTQRWGNESGPMNMNVSVAPWHLERVAEDHLVIGYEGEAPPHFVAGLYLANITPVTMNEIFYRKITAIEDDPALSQLTLMTVEVPFAEIAVQDSFRLEEDGVAFEVDEDGSITRAMDLTTREGRPELESIDIDWSGMPVFGTYTGSEGSFESGFGLPLSDTPPGAVSWDSQLVFDQASLRVTPVLDLAFETSRLIELELLKADMVLRVDAALVPRFEIESESVATDERGTLWQQCYIIPVKMAWIQVNPRIDLAAGLSAGLRGSISGGATGGFSSYIVVDYERGRVPDVRYQHGILDRHFDVVQPSLLLNGPFNAYARLIPELDINVLSLTGFYVNVDPATTLSGSATVQDLELTSAELKIRLDAHLNAGMVLWGAGSPNGLPSLEPVPIVNPPWEYKWTHPGEVELHFVQEPGNTTVQEGQRLTLVSEAHGPELIRYQWYQDGLPVKPQDRILTRGNAHAGMAGQYHVRATSGGQSAVSKTATVTVTPAPPPGQAAPVLTGTVWADIKDSTGTERLPAGEITTVLLYRASDAGEQARGADPALNPVEFSQVPYGTYTLHAYGWDVQVAVSSPFAVDSPDQSVELHAREKRPLEIAVYYSDGQTPLGGMTVTLESWNGHLEQWTERAADTTDADNGSVTFLTWPTTLPGEKYQVRILNGEVEQVGVIDDVSLTDADTGSSYAVTTLQDPPPDPEPGGMELVPGGTNAGTDPDFGAYSLTVDSFYMDPYPVTKERWDEVYAWAVTHGGYSFDRAGSGKAANHPVQGVHWYDVIKWCNARSEKEGRPAVYTVNGEIFRTGQADDVVQTSAAGYRLPTGIEWEYAARGGLIGQRFPWGDTIQHARANYWSDPSYSYDTSPTQGYHPTHSAGAVPYTSPADSFAQNGYGLYNMAGNVLEWCFDWDPSSLGSHRMTRGGSWLLDADACRAAHRSRAAPNTTSAQIGFRAALRSGQEPDPVLTGRVWADVKDADGTVRLSEGDISAVLLRRASDDDEQARATDPGSNPVEFSRVPYGTYILHAYSWDIQVAVSSPFAVDSPDQTLVLHASEKRPLEITVYHSDEQTPYGGATVKLDSWNGHRDQWTERASGTTNAASGSVTFLTWPTTLPGEKYRVRLFNGEGTQVGVLGDLSLADTDAGSSYVVTTSQEPPPPTGTVWADVKDADGTVRLSEGDISAVLLYRASGDGEQARVTDPVLNPVEFPEVSYDTYALKVYCWDMLAAVLSPFAVDSPSQTVVIHVREKRPLEITVYCNDGQTPYGGATVKLDSWNKGLNLWTERSSDTTEAASGSVTFLTWPAILPGEKYRVRILNGEGEQVGVHDTMTLADTDTGSSYSVTTSRVAPPDPGAVPAGMVLIPGGTNLGTNPLADERDDYSSNYPETYSLTVDAFYMDQYEVTETLWDEVYHWAVDNGYDLTSSSGSAKAANHPVRELRWHDAVKWCNARSEKEERPAVYTVDGAVYRTGSKDDVVQTSAAGYRLPTEVEWEYAARGGLSSQRFPWGDSDTMDRSRANYFSYWVFESEREPWTPYYRYDMATTFGAHPTYNDEVLPYTSPVGSFAPNGYGLYDMAGNVREWCFDWIPSYQGTHRAFRGGRWSQSARYCRIGARHEYDGPWPRAGFRTVLSPDPLPHTPEPRVLSLRGDLDFGTIPLGEEEIRDLVMVNLGNMDMTVSGISLPQGFNGDWSGVIGPATAQVVRITFTPQTVQSHGGDLVVYTDATSGDNTLPVVGVGVAGPDPVPGGMVLIPGGTNGGTDPDFGVYSLTVKPFYLDRHEVTKALWDEVYLWAIDNGYSFDNAGLAKAANHPVHTVNWYDAIKWCNARSEKEGRPAVYTVYGAVYRTGQHDNVVQTSATGYRLPTDAEWEYAARGGVRSLRYPWGDSDSMDHSRANYYSYWSQGEPYNALDEATTSGYHPAHNFGGVPYTSPVGSFASNGYGLYDMAGNVWEWCFNGYSLSTTSFRVNRGGSWLSLADSCRVGYRASRSPDYACHNAGFRSVLFASPSPPTLTGAVMADVKNASGTARLPAEEINTVLLYRVLDNTEQWRVTEPLSNPVEFSHVYFGTYSVEVYCWDMLTAILSSFAVDSPSQTVVLHASEKRPLEITVYYNDGQTPYVGATVTLDSWNKGFRHWTERASVTTESADGSVTFLTWPTTLADEKYRVRVFNELGTPVALRDDVTLADTDTGSSYSVTTPQPPPSVPVPSDMVLIPGGTNAGTNPLAEGETYHPVLYPETYSLTVDPFYMDQYPVTRELWLEVCGWAVTQGGYSFVSSGSSKAENHPVVNVTWYDVVKWCNARSEMEGRPAVYTVNGEVYRTGNWNAVVQTQAAGYRLPTGVEREYAARGGLVGRRFPWGDTIQHARANYDSSRQFIYDTSPTIGYHPTYGYMTIDVPYTNPVDAFAPNGYGLHDMAGNVSEWCFEWSPLSTDSHPRRMIRGGCWNCYAPNSRVGYQSSQPPGTNNIHRIGFRTVLSPDLQ